MSSGRNIRCSSSSPSNHDYYNFPEIDKFSSDDQLQIYRIKQRDPTDPTTTLVSAIDLGLLSPIQMAGTRVLTEFLIIQAQNYFMQDVQQESKTRFDLVKVSNRLILLIKLEGTDPRFLETSVEGFIKASYSSFSVIGENYFEQVLKRVLLREAPDFGSVSDFAEEDSNDLFYSNGSAHSLRYKVYQVLTHQTDLESTKKIFRDQIIENKKRIIVEFTNNSTSPILDSKDTLGGLLPKLVV